jgi:regulatory protein
MDQEITAIKQQKRNRQRVSIYLDGKYAFGLSKFVAGWLTPGRRLTKEEIRKLQVDDAFEVAFQKALQFIHYRPRSIRETYRRLLDKGFSEEVIEVIINKLIDKSLLDDFEFSRQWIENRNTFRPRSKRMLRQELRLKGVADPIIEQALEEFGGDELELAYQAGIKKAKQCQNDSKLDFRKKVGGFLGRRGYHYGIVKPTLSRLWEEFSSSAGERLSNTEKME